MNTKKILNVTATIFAVFVILLAAIFIISKYCWKIGGFSACSDAGITLVEVEEGNVHITGFYPGSFPEGFCGYYAEEQNGKLYVGFRFDAVSGLFNNGDFDINIRVKGEIDEVIVKAYNHERSVWNAKK